MKSRKMFLAISAVLILASCTNNTALLTPTITTSSVTNLTSSSASTGANVTSDGGATISERGVCWSTSANPTIANNKVLDGFTTTGSFSSSIVGLAPSTTYYVRAYASNSVGTAYGNDQSFTTLASTTTGTTGSTTGVLAVSALTTSLGGGYAPRNVVAVWVKSSAGVFVKSLLVYAAARKSDLSSWKSNSASNTTDAVTGATQTSHATRTCSWNGTNVSGTVVPNGTYILCLEINDGSRKYYEYPFEKADIASSLSPTNVSGFSNISIKWTLN